MKTTLNFIVGIILSSLLLCCSSTHPDKAKGALLLKEINEIAEKSRENMLSADIMDKIKRVEENKKNFPDSLEEIKKDAKSVLDFFAKSIEEDKQIIQKYEELLKFGLVNSEADCVNSTIKFLNSGIEQKEMILTQYALFFDETIKDKETLESKTFSVREKSKELEKKTSETEKQVKVRCTGKIN